VSWLKLFPIPVNFLTVCDSDFLHIGGIYEIWPISRLSFEFVAGSDILRLSILFLRVDGFQEFPVKLSIVVVLIRGLTIRGYLSSYKIFLYMRCHTPTSLKET
jgi:hypothetical protein